MEYTCETIINKPIAEVIELFSNPGNLEHWQKGFVSITPVSGTFGQPGSKSKLTYKMGSRTVILEETLLVNNLPEEMKASLYLKGMYADVTSSFVAVDASRTKYISKNEYRFVGIWKIFAGLMKGTTKKQARKFMEAFKAFAERS